MICVKYKEDITKIYDISINSLMSYINNIYDIDIEYIIEDMKKEDTKTYFIDTSVKMLSKIDISEQEIVEYVYAIFDTVFKYMFDIEFNFNFTKLCKNLNLEKIQFKLLCVNNWNIRNQV